MSRCFPFPPPGYEKKDDVDLLIKDKHKEKKHKKEKKDRKKEGKDKDKERSNDKDREKKERKDKDKKRSKDKKRTDENKTERPLDGSSSSGWKQNESILQAESFKDTVLLATARRSADEERGKRDQMVENLPASDPSKDDAVAMLVDKDKGKDKKRSKDKKKTNGNKTERPLDGSSSSGWKQNESNLQAETFKDTKLLATNRRIADEERGRRDQMVENFPASDPSKDDAVAMLVDKYFDNWVQDKENVEDKDGHDKKGARQTIKHDGKVIGNSFVSSFSAAEQKKTGSTVRPMEKDAEKSLFSSFSEAEQKRTGSTVKPMEKDAESKMEGREENKDQGVNDKRKEKSLVSSFSEAEQKRTGSTVKPMEKDAESKMEGKEKNKDQGVDDKRKEKKHKHRDGEKKSKEKKAEKEKAKEKVKHEDRKEKTIEVSKNHINTLNVKPIESPQDSVKSHSMEDNPRKRKDCETNGYLHDNALSNKLPRPTLSSHPHITNGKKSEPIQPVSPFASPMARGTTNNVRYDTKVLIANGLLPSVSSTSLSIPRVKARENGESSQKPPHPDAKYLSRILTVPKMDDLSDFDDQEWLFSTDSQVKKPKSVSSGVDGSPQVWDRALRIDSADICALPYVIPY